MRPLPAQQALGFGDDAGATLGLRHWPPDGTDAGFGVGRFGARFFGL
jgi:hypothetical protein